MGLLIDGAMQQAAQWGRQFMEPVIVPLSHAPEAVTYPQARVKSRPSLI
ncbi:hypothetical protein ACNI65_23535 [Roseateles sp. So40a]